MKAAKVAKNGKLKIEDGGENGGREQRKKMAGYSTETSMNPEKDKDCDKKKLLEGKVKTNGNRKEKLQF